MWVITSDDIAEFFVCGATADTELSKKQVVPLTDRNYDRYVMETDRLLPVTLTYNQHNVQNGKYCQPVHDTRNI